jgi:hypothetical protein
MAGTGEESPKNSNCGYSFSNVLIVLPEGPDMFRLEAVATGGKRNLSDNLSFTKGLQLVGCLETESRRHGIDFTERLFFLGWEIILAYGLHDWRRRTISLFLFLPWRLPCNRGIAIKASG